MIKKLLVVSLTVLFSQTAMAQDKPMSGFYGALDSGLANRKITGFAETFPPNYAAKKRTNLDIDESSAFIRGSIGYGYHFDNNVFLGAEFGYAKLTSGTDILISNAAINHEVGVSYSSKYDINALLGYDIAEKNMVFARLGYGRTNINISPRDVGGDGGAFHDLTGMIYGLGYARHFNKNISFRVEVQHFKISDSYDNIKNDSEIYDIKIKDISISAGLVFTF